jgi:hypothetical protein
MRLIVGRVTFGSIVFVRFLRRDQKTIRTAKGNIQI